MQGVLKYLIISLIAGLVCLEFLLIPDEWRLFDIGERKCITLALLVTITGILTWKRILIVPKSMTFFCICAMMLLSLLSGLWAVHLALVWPNVEAWVIYLTVFLIGNALPKEILKHKVFRTLILGLAIVHPISD